MKAYINLFALLLLTFSLHGQNDMFDVCPLKVGEEMPDVTVKNIENDTISLQQLSQDSAVFIVYRGAWCGFCIQHLRELNEIKPAIEELGYKVYGITIDKPSKIQESYDKSSGEIEVLSDASGDAMTALGLNWKLSDEKYLKYKNDYSLDVEEWSGFIHHELPVPAIYVVKNGIVTFQYVNPNYKLRLNPEILLAVLKSN